MNPSGDEASDNSYEPGLRFLIVNSPPFGLTSIMTDDSGSDLLIDLALAILGVPS